MTVPLIESPQLFMGKLPARPGAVAMQFRDYAKTSQMATPPLNFGHEGTVPAWGMLGNDQAGDCYVAGGMHETLLWTTESGTPAKFSTLTAIAYYQELTKIQNGTPFDPSQTDPWTGENPTDTGIDVANALSLRRTVGIPDVTGARHKIGAYVALNPGDLNELKYGTYYFDGVGLGIKMCDEWMEAFQSGNRVWDEVTNPNYIGGHYITAVAWRNNAPVIISWGQPVELTPAGFAQACDEVYAYLSVDRLKNGVDLEGLNLAAMQSDLKQLTKV